MSKNSSVVTLTDDEETEKFEDFDDNELDDTQVRCKQIEERISSLREALGSLLENVKKEKELWKQEMEETKALGNQLQSYVSEHEGCHNNCFSAGDSNSNQMEIDTIANTVLRNDAVAKAHIRIEMEKYQHKLSEVENMCQLEMMKLKSSVHELAPLKLIAKEWNFNKDKEHL